MGGDALQRGQAGHEQIRGAWIDRLDRPRNAELVASVCAAASLALENERLHAELRARLLDLRASRPRLVEATDAERRRIERDLHDGTQQRLVSIAMSLGLLETKLPAQATAAQPLVRETTNAGLA